MSQALQQRAKDFLARPVPKSIKYVPDSMAERIVAIYAKNGNLGSDAELLEMLELCAMETAGAVESHTGDASAYFQESAAIMEAIQAELG